jgi:hypothetical protein
MAGLTDLDEILAALRVVRRPETFTYAAVGRDQVADLTVHDGVDALIREAEGITAIVTVERARAEGWPVDIELAWLTIAVETSLEGVGLTAALATALADAGIPCNVVAALHHDHLLVPADRADEAVTRLGQLRRER